LCYNTRKALQVNLHGRFPDPDARRGLLNAVKPFLPRPRGAVETLTASGRAVSSSRPILLTGAASVRIDRAIDRTASAPVEDHVGDLREIDLDNYSMAIRNAADVREVRCTFDESLRETAKEALDRRVKVTGVRQSGSGRRESATLHVFRLEVLDEPASEAGPESEAGAAAERATRAVLGLCQDEGRSGLYVARPKMRPFLLRRLLF
jgi:hypothetical protein